MTAGSSDEIASFLRTGVYRLLDDDADGHKVVFLDPVRLLNDSYTRFSVSTSSYYSRSFQSYPDNDEHGKKVPSPSSNPKKRKRRGRSGGGEGRELNEREVAAEQRYQEARPFLLRAHEALLGATALLSVLPEVIIDENSWHFRGRGMEREEGDFIKLGRLWQAPLYEISVCHVLGSEVSSLAENGERISVQIFDNLVTNELDDDVGAEFLNNLYILPRKSQFYMT